MPTQPVNTAQGLSGTQPYGSVQGVETAAILPYYIQSGTEPAFPSGNKYEGKSGVCIHEGMDGLGCKAPRAKGTDFCIGHLRKIEKALKAKEEKETETKEEE
jgi:hypothetical protein